MNPIYFIIALVVGLSLTTCESHATPETVAAYGPIEIGSQFVNGGNPVQPWGYAAPVEPSSALFPSQSVSIPIPTGNTILDFLQLLIVGWIANKFRQRRKPDDPEQPDLFKG